MNKPQMRQKTIDNLIYKRGVNIKNKISYFYI